VGLAAKQAHGLEVTHQPRNVERAGEGQRPAGEAPASVGVLEEERDERHDDGGGDREASEVGEAIGGQERLEKAATGNAGEGGKGCWVGDATRICVAEEEVPAAVGEEDAEGEQEAERLHEAPAGAARESIKLAEGEEGGDGDAEEDPPAAGVGTEDEGGGNHEAGDEASDQDITARPPRLRRVRDAAQGPALGA
jgi:hypothetical protein